MKAAYHEAIEIIAFGKPNYTAIAIRLAQENPQLFVEYATVECESTKVKRNMDSSIIKFGRGERVAGIKFCRTVTGMGLKEAKDYCDALLDKNEISSLAGISTTYDDGGFK